MKGKQFRNPGRERRRLAIFLSLLAVLAIVLAFFTLDGGQHWDEVRRFFAYGGRELQISMDTFPQRMTAAGDRLVTAGLDGVTFYDLEGHETFTITTSWGSPVLDSEKDLLLCYDAGGTGFFLLDERGEDLISRDPNSGVVLDADLAPDGAMCYLNLSDRSKTQLQVFDHAHRSCFVVDSATRYFLRCALSEGADYVCTIALDQEEGSFVSKAVLYRTSQEKPIAEVDLGNQIIYDVTFWDRDTVCILGENELLILNTKGEVEGRYACPELVNFDLNGDGYAALLLPEGAGYALVTVDRHGRELGRLSLSNVQALEANGSYTACMGSQGLMVLDKKLRVLHQENEPGSSGMLCICDTGAVYYTNTKGVGLCLP